MSRRLALDLRVHFVKGNGGTRPKVFKAHEVELEAGDRAAVSKLISLRQHTRIHYPGHHLVELIVNGVSHPIARFVITGAPAL